MKAKLIRKGRKQGQAPGAMESPAGALPPQIHVFAYDADSIEEVHGPDMNAIAALRKKWPMIWVNVTGLGDASLIAALGSMFALHPLALEDVLHTPQRPKIDEFDENVYVTLRMLEYEGDQIAMDQLSLFWGDGFVLSIQERPGDGFGPIRDRLRKGGRRVKMVKADYMAYAIIDAVVDGYFPALESYGDKIDTLEEKILTDPSPQSMREVHRTKRDLGLLKVCVWPIRDVLSKMRGGVDHISEETQLYLRDCHDHAIQVLDIIESYRERLSSLNDLYLSSVSARLNEVMKVLTIISTIFIPLSFVAGIYGMNFDTHHPWNMPELSEPYGYPMVLIFMAAMAGVMMWGFYRAGWIGRGNGKR